MAPFWGVRTGVGALPRVTVADRAPPNLSVDLYSIRMIYESIYIFVPLPSMHENAGGLGLRQWHRYADTRFVGMWALS